MSDIKKKALSMTFDPNVIDDLGAKLYSNLPPILSELIANGYDACAREIKIELKDSDEDNKEIVIIDDGFGMDFDDINDKYLHIGRKRRAGEGGRPTLCGRLPIGKKGLGKLAFFGIAKHGLIETTNGDTKITFEMDWDKILSSGAKSGSTYMPEFTVEKVTGEKPGTKIILSKIFRKTDFDIESLKKSLSNYFIFDDDFRVFIGKNGAPLEEITNEIKYEDPDRSPEFEWEFPKTGVEQITKQFSFTPHIKGKIILFDKPVRSNLRGVTLFARKKLVNLPEFFPVQGSSFFFQYLTGWLEVDFVDDFTPDVISTNRSSLNWNDDKLEELKEFLAEVIQFIHQDWRDKKKKITETRIATTFNINPRKWRESNKNNPKIRENIDKFTQIMSDPEDIEEDQLLKVSEIIYDLVPEYADFVLWRNLHPRITENEIIRQEYFNGDYLQATKEAVQIYNEAVQTISTFPEDGYKLMEKSFGKEAHKKIWVTNKSNESEENIEEGQKLMSQGVMVGFKNPAVSHTSRTRMVQIGQFSDRNCLDILNTVSYLFDRLDKRIQPLPAPPGPALPPITI